MVGATCQEIRIGSLPVSPRSGTPIFAHSTSVRTSTRRAAGSLARASQVWVGATFWTMLNAPIRETPMTALYHGTGFQEDLAAAIGHTPLIRLRRASEATGCTILGKAEFMNPGGSVKDRAGLAIIEDAVARGLLKPGGTIVEGTAGNTGIGLTLVANALGCRSIIVVPETQSREKLDFLRMIGA